jgi:diketogulonate reductase-like aldo/keto reductase
MTANLRGTRVPSFLYGTAWKEEVTEALVVSALAAGFRGIDTANQRKHYFEEGVGRALTRKFRDRTIRREELFIQSKFTFRDGQDHRLPYDPRAPVAEQVVQSFRSSLAHLGVDALDSLVLHGPSQRNGLARADGEAWRAMEALADQGRVALLGISNVTPRQVKELIELARVPPAFVQNRCYAERGWDREVRTLCNQQGILYQGFSLLTANRDVLARASVRAIATRHGKTPAQIVFRYAQQVGMLPITGTSDPTHMKQDLDICEFELSEPELAIIDAAGSGGDRRN